MGTLCIRRRNHELAQSMHRLPVAAIQQTRITDELVLFAYKVHFPIGPNCLSLSSQLQYNNQLLKLSFTLARFTIPLSINADRVTMQQTTHCIESDS